MVYIKKLLDKVLLLVKRKDAILLAGILLIAFFFRFYNYPLRYGFDYDATRDALVAISGSNSFQLPIVGPPSSVGPFHFGPWYYYQLILADALIPLPFAPWIYTGILSILFVFIMYQIGVLLENNKLGLILAALSAISPDQIGRANGLTNPNLVSICAALSILFFIILMKRKTLPWYYFLWGLILGIGINNHFQMVGLVILPVFLFVNKRIQILRNISHFALGIFIAFIPMFIFNVTYYWHTVRMFVYYILYMRHLTYIPNRWITYASDFWPTYTGHVLGIPALMVILIHFGAMASICLLIYKKKLQITYFFLFLTYAINFMVLRYYGGERLYHNFNYIQPLLFIIVGFFAFTLFKNSFTKIIGILLIIFLLLFPVQEDLRRIKPVESQMRIRKEVSDIQSQFPSEAYAIYNCISKYDNRTQSVALLLYYDNKLIGNGKKIGFVNDDCFNLLQDDKKYTRIRSGSRDELKKLYPYYERLSAVDLTNTSEADLLADGWSHVTPDTIYDKAVRWWFYEKP